MTSQLATSPTGGHMNTFPGAQLLAWLPRTSTLKRLVLSTGLSSALVSPSRAPGVSEGLPT